jgi:hypothetical protein
LTNVAQHFQGDDKAPSLPQRGLVKKASKSAFLIDLEYLTSAAHKRICPIVLFCSFFAMFLLVTACNQYVKAPLDRALGVTKFYPSMRLFF